MGITVDTSQGRALAAKAVTAGVRLGAKGSAVVRRAALAVEADAKALAPVDTGNLRSSISSSFTGDGRGGAMTAEVGPTADYGIYQEFGTSTQAGTPFMGPAFDRQLPGFEAAVAQLANEVI